MSSLGVLEARLVSVVTIVGILPRLLDEEVKIFHIGRNRGQGNTFYGSPMPGIDGISLLSFYSVNELGFRALVVFVTGVGWLLGLHLLLRLRDEAGPSGSAFKVQLLPQHKVDALSNRC